MALNGFLKRMIGHLTEVPSGNPELLKAQYRAFARQIPLMYVVLMTNTWILASTHLAVAPAWLALGFPVLMSVVSAVRLHGWWRSRGYEPDAAFARKALMQTNRLSFVMATAFAAWSLALFGYGDARTQAHVAFYMAITVISCIFCMMHLRSAALIVAVIVNIAFFVFFAGSGEPTFVAVAVNNMLVSLAMLFILNINYRQFTALIEARTQAEALGGENFRLANIDSLTELPNRRAFFSALERGFADDSAARRELAVGLADLDGFKPVNDAYGHGAGDRLLIEAGRRMAAICGEAGAALAGQAEALRRALSEPFLLENAAVRISVSIGIAVRDESTETADELLHRADYALYHGKRQRRGTVVRFADSHSAKLHREAQLEQSLRKADLAREMRVVFEPIVDLRRGGVAGFEALARWTSPAHGAVDAGEFVPLAERIGLMPELSRHLLRLALAEAATWPAPTRLAFNLWADDLASSEKLLAVTNLVMASGFDPARLDIEIKETLLARDIGRIATSAALLRNLGCGLTIDGFGTGYSSLSRLHELPLTKLKIARPFVVGLGENATSASIVRSLVALSRDTGIACLVEGVETAQDLAAVRALGAGFAQGASCSPPVEGAAIPALFAPRSTCRPGLKTIRP